MDQIIQSGKYAKDKLNNGLIYNNMKLVTRKFNNMSIYRNVI